MSTNHTDLLQRDKVKRVLGVGLALGIGALLARWVAGNNDKISPKSDNKDKDETDTVTNTNRSSRIRQRCVHTRPDISRVL